MKKQKFMKKEPYMLKKMQNLLKKLITCKTSMHIFYDNQQFILF